MSIKNQLQGEIILIFESIHKVLKAEKLLLENKFSLEIIPIPKDLSSNCGISIKIEKKTNNIDSLKEILENNRIDSKMFDR